MSKKKILRNASLVFLRQNKRIILAKKKKKIGKGLWNGYGGEREENETFEASARREAEEECGVVIDPASITQVAIITFHNNADDGSCSTCLVHAFFARRWDGQPHETDEMGEPKWFHEDTLPLSEMMPADQIWFPEVMTGKLITAEFSYGPFQKELIGLYKITPATSLP